MTADNLTYKDDYSVHGGALGDIVDEDRAAARKGAEILAACLCEEGVEVVFGYPGGANLEIFDVLDAHAIRCIRVEHEQGAVHAAQGYARATGRVGVCLATSGPGATNLVTGIADANSDSTPIVAITGNVPTRLLGKNAFQEVDIVSIVEPVTKRAYLVDRVVHIPEIVREAFALAAGGRPGPVLIDVPKDIQQQYPKTSRNRYAPPEIPALIEAPEPATPKLTAAQLEECARLIREARRPMLYVGGGVIHAAAEEALQAFVDRFQIPITNTIMGLGAFDPEHPCYMDVLGMHGAKYANLAINEADLVIALGVRFDDRVTGDPERFIREAKIIHIDIDRDELNKNKTVTLPIQADLGQALQQLLSASPGDTADWLAYCQGLKRDFPYPLGDSRGAISPQRAIQTLSELTGGKAIVSLGVGQHQMWAMQHYRPRQTRSFLSSSGFGTMGYGLPAAIGAKLACPERLVIDIDGDGSLNMSIHELSTCHRYGLGVKIVVINNQWLGMVRQWQDMIYDGHHAGSDLSDPRPAAADGKGQGVYPDFVTIAAGYRVAALRVTEEQELEAAFARMLADPSEPFLLDVIVSRQANVYPMIPAGGSHEDIIMSDADLDPAAARTQGANI